MAGDETIAINGSRRQASLTLLGGLLVTALLLPGMGSSWFRILLFAVTAVGTAAQIIVIFRPNQLLIGPRGVLLRALLFRKEWQWSEVDNFRVEKTGSSNWIMFDRISTTPLPPNLRRWSAFYRWMKLRPEGFAADWTLSPDEVSSLLNKTRARWAG